ncbi:hypothetical protein DFP72DRAFT_904908 [Ephemerocybe angulata]|uniref:Uncharacterized protein n=1 Tax=Ephemerocybe angulata TaxID=980116 RepID=A0A8H6HV80_9AGAR|nr:hypothetical protein DFP72DRAFT_904908 [Tulosesus angulatus]
MDTQLSRWLLVGLSVFNLSLFCMHLWTQRKVSSEGQSKGDGWERLPGPFEEVALTLNHTFLPLDENWTWDRLVAGGYVRLGKEGRTFGVSFYHVLHCLSSIRADYREHSGRARRPMSHHHRALDVRADGHNSIADHFKHDNHCLQFVAQSLICRADTRLYPLRDDGSIAYEASEGDEYRCRDWAGIRKEIRRNWKSWKGIPFTNTPIVT